MDGAITRDQFLTLFQKANKDKPRPEDVRKLREALSQSPSLVEYAGSMAIQSRQALLNSTKMTAAAREILDAGANHLAEELGYSNASKLEQLLIEQIVTCYLRLHLWEYIYHAQSGSENLRLSQVKDWESMIATAQKRFFRAIETLVRVRRLGIQIQINVATEGGQQINIS
jgi:hypothetical protein